MSPHSHIPHFDGEVITPGDERYDQARRVWNPAIDRRPALIARAHGTRDVVAVIRHARDTGLRLSVRGGGHSAAGLAVADDALMLDLSAMKAVAVDPAARTAVTAPGLTWAEFDAATGRHGLATTGGVVGSTGIAGLTLGGGIGWLDRLYGLTCDNLISTEIVTADGRVLTASGQEHPGLLWALRGGGGNFGVVTSFTFGLHPVSRGYGGFLIYPFTRAADVLRAYAEIGERAPRHLALYATLLTAPPLPFIPPALQGHRLAVVFAVSFAALDEAERTVASVRDSLPPSLADTTGPLSYERLQQQGDALSLPGSHHYYTAEWLDVLDDKAIGALLDAAERATSPRSVIVLKRMGGATGRVPVDGTAFWYRQAAYNLDIHAQWAPGGAGSAEDGARHREWAHAIRRAVAHASAGGGYVNFIGDDQDASRVLAAYGGNYPRLGEVKAAYDPENFFRLNHNIVPASPGARESGRRQRAGTSAHTIHRSGPPGAGS